MIADALRKRQLPIIGRGEAMWAMIHTDDAASAYVAAAEKPANGVWHIVDNELVEIRVFLNEFAALLQAPAPRRIPLWLAKWFADEQAVSYLTKSTRTSNVRFRGDFEWSPRYPTYREGLQQIIAAWKNSSSKTVVA